MPGKGVPRVLVVSVLGLLALGLVVLYAVYRLVISSGITAGPDRKFGDQHLKTAAALLELHKVRYGRFPATLRELRFVGDWDRIALQAVSYASTESGDRYCVRVERGWVGKPTLNMPAEFWQGTGYDASLCAP